MICQFQIYIKKIRLRKYSAFNWFTPFHVLISPDVIWKNVSRPLYHAHFTVIHTNSRHKTIYTSVNFVPNWRHCKNAQGTCYVAICDCRNLWRCRNLWLKVSQFVTGVAICDGKCRNLWQRRNMQFNEIYSLNFDKYFVLSSYLY